MKRLLIILLIVITPMLFSAPLARAQVSVTIDMVPMRDGTRLATDIYQNDGWTSGPVILIRTPYGRDGQRLPAIRWAETGRYAVAVQDVRGRGGSEGTDTVFRDDATDGLDTLDWLESQEFCNGQVGTYGGSALGITQYLLAGQGHPALQCQWVPFATGDFYLYALFQGAVFRKEATERWYVRMGNSHLLEELAAHSLLDEYWDPVRLEGLYGQVQARAVHFTGWYDMFLQGALDAYGGYQTLGGSGASGEQKLIVGPWTHGGLLQTQQGELTYPPNSVWTLGDQAETQWFDWCLVGQQTGAQTWPAVQYYLMGDVDDPEAPGNEWREAEQWPPEGGREVAYHLLPSGSLDPGGPAGDARSSTFVSDPEDPVPAVGGPDSTFEKGPRDQRSVETRSDVLVYTTSLLTEPVEVTGRVNTRLFFSADVPDCDLMVRLSDVYPDGRSMLVTDGALRTRHRNTLEAEELLTEGAIYEADIDLWSTAMVFNAGHRIRISISGSSDPRFEVNPQTGEPFRQHTHTRIGQISIHHGPDHPSALLLPVMNTDLTPDGGTPDGGTPDSGTSDAGVADAGSAPLPESSDQGCSCGSTGHEPPAGLWLLAFVLLGIRARRNRHSERLTNENRKPL